MNNNRLVLLDAFLGFALVPIGLLVKFTRRKFHRIIANKPKGTLVIKFLGAGNLVAIQDFLERGDCDLLTAKTNFQTVEYFKIGRKKLYIDEGNIFSLIFSSLKQILILLSSNYDQVINLETESNFAKFLTAISSANSTLGISNRNKSYIDYILYDLYLVNPIMTSKLEVLKQLTSFHPTTNDSLKITLDARRDSFLKSFDFDALNRVVLSPTCSNTDQLRRLSTPQWGSIIISVLKAHPACEIVAVFPSQKDQQYFEFQALASHDNQLKIEITSYVQFIKAIEDADLLITVDSQALHIAQQLKKKAISIYGPTSPFGVSLGDTTYPISKSLECSPCTHKYLKVPCQGNAKCMHESLPLL